ncbi:MAG: rhodanese-like domain-containing protein [Gemmatimonadota bacterium]
MPRPTSPRFRHAPALSLRVALPLVAALALLAPSAPLVAQAPVLVGADWLRSHRADPGLVLLHVAMVHQRPPTEFIEGARVLDYMVFADEADGLSVQIQPVERMVEALRAAGVSNDSRVIVYGDPLLAARIVMTLDYLGHGDHTSYLDGGLAAWKSGGGPVSAEAAAAARPGTFEPNVRTDLVVDADWIHTRLDDPSVSLVDARPEDEYTGARRPGELRAGHIPGAYNLYWEDLIVSRDNPVLRTLDEVRARYAASGAEAGGTVVSYCYIGMRASYAWMISKHLGYDARFYDGSWDEWARRTDLPAVEGKERR